MADQLKLDFHKSLAGLVDPAYNGNYDDFVSACICFTHN